RLGKTESRHVNFQPRPNLTGLGSLQEGEEPSTLHLRPFPMDDRGRERRVRLEGAEGTSRALDDVAALTVVVLDDPPSALDRRLFAVQLLLRRGGGVELLKSEHGGHDLVELPV